jgi:hypothetical protein
MAKAIYLAQIRNRMESIQKEYNALSEAYQILDRVGSSRGRKAKIPTLQEMLGSEIKVKTGKRGRPPGAKNKPGSKKPGPKTNVIKSVAAADEKASEEVKKTVIKPIAAKRGRPAKAVKPVKVEKTQAVVASVSKPIKPVAKSAKPKSVAKPVSKPTSKQITKKPGTRNRIPNLAEKIQEIVGKNARFTTNSVITDKLAGLYPGKSRSDLGKYISVILANMKARKELAVVTQDAKGNKMRSGLWGLPNWFEGTKPKAEFLK